MSRMKRRIKTFINKFDYDIIKSQKNILNCPSFSIPSKEIFEKADSYFSNTFSISPESNLTREDLEKIAKKYYWHYPFQFDGLFIDSDHKGHQGLRGRHYQRYMHIFPPILSMIGGSLTGNTVLDIGCNCGFWSIQARFAGADSIMGLEGGSQNIEQANFILQIIGLDGIEYRVMNAYDITRELVGEFDITFFFGLLYHLDKPILALERLYEVTKNIAVVDTTLEISSLPMLKLKEDIVHNQNYSNDLAFVPSQDAVPLMLQHVGFRKVFCIQNATINLPPDYLAGTRKSFIALK